MNKTINFISPLFLIILLFLSNNIFGQTQTDSTKQIYFQGGYFNTDPEPSISSIQSINIGFYAFNLLKGKIGISAKYRTGENDEIEKADRLIFNGTTWVDSFSIIGGNRKLNEIELTIDYKRKCLDFKKLRAGIICSAGYNQRRILNKPDQNGNTIDQEYQFLLLSLNPYIEFDLTKRISIFSDFSFIKLKNGKRKIKTIDPKNNIINTDVIQFNLETPYTINEFDLGISINF